MLPLPCGLALNGENPPFVSGVAEGSAAAGRITVGNDVLRVNGKDVSKMKHTELVELMRPKCCKKRVKLRLRAATESRRHTQTEEDVAHDRNLAL